MSIEQAFIEYERITSELYNIVMEYSDCFQQMNHQIFKESILNERVSEKEKAEIAMKISELEKNIQKLFERLLRHTDRLIGLLEKETVLDLSSINKLNREHIEAMIHYENVIEQFNLLKEDYKEYDFDAVVDFSKMEKQKMKLNIAIKEVNAKVLGSRGLHLLDAFECRKEIFQKRKELFEKIL